MVDKYFGKALPESQKEGAIDNELINFAINLRKEYEIKMDNYKFSSALSNVWLLISKCNKYIDETMPWKLSKDPNKKDRLARVMYNLCECLRIISILITPFMPDTSKKIQDQIGAHKHKCTWKLASEWGILPYNLEIQKGDSLFPRIDVKKELEELNKMVENNAKIAANEFKAKNEEAAENVVRLIDIEDFAKIKLIAAKIIECEPIKKSKKLLKLTVDDGQGERTVVSGISQYYTPEELIGKSIILVSNLKPAKLCGVESNGMILAATCPENKVKVIFDDEEIPAGSKIC